MKYFFLMIKMVLMVSQICDKFDPKLNYRQESLRLLRNERYDVQQEMNNLEGNLDVFHREFYFSQEQTYFTKNIGAVQQIYKYFDYLYILQKQQVSICNMGNCYFLYNAPYQSEEELENIVQRDTLIIIQTRQTIGQKKSVIFYICNLQKCYKGSNFLSLEDNDQLIIGKQYIIITDITKQRIAIYQYLIYEYDLLIDENIQLNSEIVLSKFNTIIQRIVSIKLFDNSSNEYLLLLNDQNELYQYSIDKQVLQLLYQIDINRHIKSFNYFEHQLIYIFEQQDKYFVQSNQLYQNRYINENTNILTVYLNKQRNFILYNNNMIFDPDETTLPLIYPIKTQIYHNNEQLYILEENQIRQMSVFNYYQINYIQSDKVGIYEINFELPHNIKCILKIEIGEQFTHSIKQLEDVIVINSDHLLFKKSIQIPGIQFELLEDHGNILKQSYQNEFIILQSCITEDFKLKNEFAKPQYYNIQLMQVNSNRMNVIKYKIIQQFEDGIYEFDCQNNKILSQSQLLSTNDFKMNKQFCYENENLIILAGNLITIIQINDTPIYIDTGQIHFKLDSDCFLTDDSNIQYKIIGSSISEILEWNIQNIVNSLNIGRDCLISSISILAEAQLLKLLLFQNQILIIIYSISDNQFASKYSIQKCKLSKFYDLPLYNFVIDLPLKVQQYQSEFVIQASFRDKKYLLLFDLDNQKWQCLKFVLEIQSSENYVYFQKQFIQIDQEIKLINTMNYFITFNKHTDIKFNLKWRIYSDYAQLDQNEIKQTIFFNRNNLTQPKNSQNIKFVSKFKQQSIQINQFFQGSIHNISVSNEQVSIKSPLTQKIKLYHENQKIISCCINVENNLYYLTSYYIIRQKTNNELKKFTFEERGINSRIELIYFENHQLLAVFQFDYILGQNFVYFLNLGLEHITTIYLPEMIILQKIIKYQEFVILHINRDQMSIYQFHNYEFIPIIIPGKYNQIHFLKDEIVLYYLQDQFVQILRAEILNFKIIPLEVNQFDLNSKMIEFQNIKLTIDAIQIYGKEEINALLFTSKGIFIMNLREKINNVILFQTELSQSFVVQKVQNYLIMLVSKFDTNLSLQIEVYDLTQQNIILHTIQSLEISTDSLQSSIMADEEHLYLVLSGFQRHIIIYQISQYFIQFTEQVQNISLVASNEYETLTVQVQISYTIIQMSQLCTLLVYLTILGTFIFCKLKIRARSYEQMRNEHIKDNI